MIQQSAERERDKRKTSSRAVQSERILSMQASLSYVSAVGEKRSPHHALVSPTLEAISRQSRGNGSRIPERCRKVLGTRGDSATRGGLSASFFDFFHEVHIHEIQLCLDWNHFNHSLFDT